MTGVALGAGLDMGRIFARGCRAIVTLGAAARRHAVMIEHRRYPAVGGMAVIAGIGRTDMGWIFTRGGGAVVAGRTGTDYIGMIDPDNRYPGGVAMAVFTQCVGLDVGRVFAGSGRAVVATGTAATDTVVIEHRARPAVGAVAIVTGITAADMVG